MMNRREYKHRIQVNGRSLHRVIIDQHYRTKHGDVIDDGLILNLIDELQGQTFPIQDRRGEFEYFAVEPVYRDHRPYRLVLVLCITEDYLGVSVVGIEEADAVLPGTIRTVQFQLMYPGVDYSGLAVGSRFEIREGQRSVGEGIVIERIEEES